jgi:hypothetical protein
MCVVCLRMIAELGHVLNEPTDKDVTEWASFFKGAIA